MRVIGVPDRGGGSGHDVGEAVCGCYGYWDSVSVGVENLKELRAVVAAVCPFELEVEGWAGNVGNPVDGDVAFAFVIAAGGVAPFCRIVRSVL